MEINNELTHIILKHAYSIHTALGPGLLEASYKECLFYELTENGLFVEKEKALPLFYKNVKMNIGYRVDLLVENSVIIEIKCVDSFKDIHVAQVLNYLNLSGCNTGLLLNFKTTSLKNGIKRIVV